MRRVRVYPDTNVLLHCRPLHALDWKRITGADDVVVVLTSVVISEVDKKKHDTSKQVRNRARDASTWLATLRKEPERVACAGAAFDLVRRSADRATLESHGLDLQEKDDCQLALILDDLNASERAHDFLCFTSDNLMVLKAEHLGIPVAEPAEEDLRPDEPDDEQKEMRELRRQMAEHRNARPSLNLFFASDPKAKFIDVALIVRRFRRGDIDRISRAEQHALRMPFELHGVGNVGRHLEKYRAWLGNFDTFHYRRSLTSTLRLAIGNESTTPADNVVIDLRVPEHLRLSDEREEIEDEPQPPKRNEHLLHDALRIPVPRFRARSSTRLHDDGRGLRLTFEYVHARDRRQLPDLLFWFEDAQAIKGFSVTYEIRSAAAGEPESGELHVRVSSTEEPLQLPPDDE